MLSGSEVTESSSGESPRFYDPRLGRFYAQDLQENSTEWNSYSYVSNAPLMGRDPFGRNAIVETAILLLLIALAGCTTDQESCDDCIAGRQGKTWLGWFREIFFIDNVPFCTAYL